MYNLFHKFDPEIVSRYLVFALFVFGSGDANMLVCFLISVGPGAYGPSQICCCWQKNSFPDIGVTDFICKTFTLIGLSFFG